MPRKRVNRFFRGTVNNPSHYRWRIVKIPGPHCPHPYTQSFPPLSISPAKSALWSPRSYEVHLDSECLQEVNWSLEGQTDGSEREIPAPTSHRSGHWDRCFTSGVSGSLPRSIHGRQMASQVDVIPHQLPRTASKLASNNVLYKKHHWWTTFQQSPL